MRTTDGFELAEVDLELRGEGSLLAARQSGVPDLRHARLSRHRRLAAAGARARRRRSWPPTPTCESAAARADGDRGAPHVRRRRRLADARALMDRGRRAQGHAAATPRPGRARGRPPTGCASRCSRSWATSPGLRVLDPFAGSGALGLRGALARRRAGPTFCETAAPALRGAAGERASGSGTATGARCAARTPAAGWRRIARAGADYELVLLDPPYRMLPALHRAPCACICRHLLAPGGRAVIESPASHAAARAAARGVARPACRAAPGSRCTCMAERVAVCPAPTTRSRRATSTSSERGGEVFDRVIVGSFVRLSTSRRCSRWTSGSPSSRSRWAARANVSRGRIRDARGRVRARARRPRRS